ncbi:putative ABC transport system permease protein [Chryseolinea serpens]|uniref:Putative ABC transport system permease protein n=1 Tax=Chryseolinea serpens TaxID=947013 RepID=A0A1M5L9R7_9BACT|nr:ABC transporter permease [Chryseolinea serpens]SHG61748.1 putative ABC transport system permease protein [Chryseolinea serpens]
MFQNYFKTAIRSIVRERYYALIKIAGLALGLGTSLVLFLYVTHQLSYDTMHPDVDRLYRVNQTNIWNPKGGFWGSTGPAVANALITEYPAIESVLRINTPGGQIVRYTKPNRDVVAINEESVLAADSTFFSFFAFELKEGDPRTALEGKNKVVLSDKAAKRLFGDEPALGKLIQIGDKRETVEVTGVTKEQPTNVHFHFDYLLSMPTIAIIKDMEWSWIFTQVVTYVKLKPGTDVATLNKTLKTLPMRYAPATFKRIGIDFDEFIKERGAWEVYLQPMREMRLYSTDTGNRLGPVGDIKYVYVFSIVAAFILLIAVVNFINLSTARGASRAKEVGVKKTLGLHRASLIAQFQVENILVTFVAMLLGLGVMELLRLVIQPLTGLEIPVTLWDNKLFFAIIILLPLVVGFLAGLYPAFYLTSFRPAQVLKGKTISGLRTSNLRNVLVVFQFTISIALMVATMVVFDQLKYFQSASLGFNQESMLIVNNGEKLGNQLQSFRDELATYPGVVEVSASADFRKAFEDIFMREGNDLKLPIAYMKIDEYYMATAQHQLVAGRGFEPNRPSDVNAVILNETAVRLYGWTPEQAIGQHIIYVGDDVGRQEIIGVVKDFHFRSLYETINPFMFFNIKSKMFGDIRTVAIRFNTPDVPSLIAKIEKRWNQIADATPFEYNFLDESLKMRYQEEQRLGSLFSVFTVLSITIAIIGLVGLVAYSAEQRKKEIGVRKVFGASLTSIYVMMNTQYVKLLVVALIIATPLSWWAMQQWLDTFQYRVSISPWLFVWAGAAELILAMVCVGYLALRAASLNPATVLKEE